MLYRAIMLLGINFSQCKLANTRTRLIKGLGRVSARCHFAADVLNRVQTPA
ncbi:hypothetical protein Mapa_008004 [Marchantia paleacea]|nr:hypothetical protein Mapa_008004 [Marchantia paleacea]